MDPTKTLADINAQPDVELYLSWQVRRPSDDCPITIYFCFLDFKAQYRLSGIMKKAFTQWGKALGANRGITFQFTQAHVQTRLIPGRCYDQSGAWGTTIPSDVGVVAWNDVQVREFSYIGYDPRSDRGRMLLRFDDTVPDIWTTSEEKKDAWNVRSMAHEIGM